MTKIERNHASVKFLTYDFYGHRLAANYPEMTIVRYGSDVPILMNLVPLQETSPCHPSKAQLLTPFAVAPRLASARGF